MMIRFWKMFAPKIIVAAIADENRFSMRPIAYLPRRNGNLS